MNIGHDVSSDHSLQSPLPRRLFEEVVIRPGNLSSVPQPAERLIAAGLFITGRPATRHPGATRRGPGSLRAHRLRVKPPGSPARRQQHSSSSIRAQGQAKATNRPSCLLLLLKPAKRQCLMGLPSTVNAPPYKIQSKPLSTSVVKSINISIRIDTEIFRYDKISLSHSIDTRLSR